jgi:DNA-binding transcriptional ArsR family regulator
MSGIAHRPNVHTTVERGIVERQRVRVALPELDSAPEFGRSGACHVQHRLTQIDARMVAKFFRALGDPTRLRLLEFLLHEEHTVSECVAQGGLSQGRVSTHLACVADCGYVQVRRTGRNALYTVADPRVAQPVMLAHASRPPTAPPCAPATASKGRDPP